MTFKAKACYKGSSMIAIFSNLPFSSVSDELHSITGHNLLFGLSWKPDSEKVPENKMKKSVIKFIAELYLISTKFKELVFLDWN